MTPLRPHRTVKCKTIDGILLEAWFWEVKGPAPVIVMSHGVSVAECFRGILTPICIQLNCIKEMSLQQTAEGFQATGYNVILYDSRNVGGSAGFPRNQIDPWQISQDLSGMSRVRLVRLEIILIRSTTL